MIKILQSFEAFLYEVALWMILMPKTLLKVIVAPRWIYVYVTLELEKDVTERYEAYVSPILFFLVSGVLALFGILRAFSEGFAAASYKQYGNLENTLLLMSLMLVTFPTGFSLVIQLFRRQPITRTALRPVFFTQCMHYAAFYPILLLLSVLFLRKVRMQKGTAEPVSFVDIMISMNSSSTFVLALVLDVFILLLIHNELRIITQILGIGWPKALLVLVLGFVTAYLLATMLSVLIFVPLRA